MDMTFGYKKDPSRLGRVFSDLRVKRLVLDSLSNQTCPLLQDNPYKQKFAKYNNDKNKVEKSHNS